MNRLARETSPYLRQHADNPVDWHPWDAEALDLARREDRPILLSIGYSACHWCHVMAHESFEDPATAALMNRLFVNIKVDREERPDLDRIYQTAHQLLTRRGGGWPLTLFLDPRDRVAFFAGTYFPPTPRHGLPGFAELLEQVAAYFRDHRDEIQDQNRRLQAAQADLEPAAGHEGALEATPLDLARQQLGQAFDALHGGFGDAPKFPQPTRLDRLLRHWAACGDDRARHMACHTLRRMAAGGLQDHLGGGFHRYAVDERWEIPHFEKMLYDNGQLLALYAQAWAATGDPLFAEVARDTARWALAEMTDPAGGFHAALDADSEGGEGRYYLWDRDEVRALLEAAEYAAFAPRYGLEDAPNFESHWHLRRSDDGWDEAEDTRRLLASARWRLLAARRRRPAPGRDHKVLTAWNALLIRGLAIAARHLDEPAWGEAATAAVDFIRRELWHDGGLAACWTQGRVGPPAYLDDHAFLLDALLELLQLRWRRADLDFASALAEVLLERFADREAGGFYFTAHDHEPLIHRPKPYGDDALPSGNGVAAYALQRLGHLLGDARYLEAAERTLRNAWPAITALPYAHDSLLAALEEHLSPPTLVILRGAETDPDAWRAVCQRPYAPHRLCLSIPAAEADLPGALGGCRAGEGPLAYVCRGTTCTPPVTDPAALAALLEIA